MKNLGKNKEAQKRTRFGTRITFRAYVPIMSSVDRDKRNLDAEKRWLSCLMEDFRQECLGNSGIWSTNVETDKCYRAKGRGFDSCYFYVMIEA